MNCTNCGEPVQESLCRCHCCDNDIGFPNVRAAGSSVERDALSARLKSARDRAAGRGCASQLAEFHDLASRSSAVVAMSAYQAYGLLNPSALYTNYHKKRSAETILPKDNRYDKIRTASDAKVFPNYFEKITFAALSIDGRGSRYYGSVSLGIKDVAIERRATVFERNTLLFLDGLRQEEPIPFGMRAVWGERHDLAAAKLEQKIDSACTTATYAELLLSQEESADADFVEVHIYDPLHISAVAKIALTTPTDAQYHPDCATQQDMVRGVCGIRGIPCEGPS